MITYILHTIPMILSVILVYKAITILYNLRKQKRDMYYLTRKQVIRFVSSLTLFGLIYIILQLILYTKQLWVSPTWEEIVQCTNEVFLIFALIFLIFKFRKK